jgi:GntR family transcriptional regulator, transcriptional repressor for pyruvate dehydrogenase complex
MGDELTESARVRFTDRASARRPARLAAAVAEDLIDAVVGGKLPAGSVLPGEQSLCEDFGVSRVVIREALKSLEQKGLLIIRQGHGTVVAPSGTWDPLDSMVLDARIRHDENLAVLDNVVQVRVALEAELAATAATCRTEGQVTEMYAALDAMASVLDNAERYLTLELEFHDQIMRMSGNDVGRAVVTSIHNHARLSNRYSGGELDKQIEAAHAGHTAIAKAITDADSAAARGAMRSHILDSWRSKQNLRGRSPETSHPTP